MRVAIIGAGAAGLTSAKNAKEKGLHCVVYEQWSEIGGIWVYTDYTDFDQYGYPVLNPMYTGLIANLPKEIMAFSNFPFPETPKSYLPHQEILDYLNMYADHFKLRKLIKFNTLVTLIHPLNDGRWEVKTEDKVSRNKTIDIFDAVMVCVGNYHNPRMPTIQGMDIFKGEQIHSKMYRKPDKYMGKVVLLIGGGISAIDIVNSISPVAKQVIFNYRTLILNRTYPENVLIKEGEIKILGEHSVTFSDDISINIDCIIYCTGYYHRYPFLHKSCGITDGELVQPLYKHVININNPTMAFIGLPIYISPFITYDLQARFFINHLLGVVEAPSQKEMIEDLESDVKIRRLKGYVGSKFHSFEDCQKEYYDDLSKLGKTDNVPDVIRYIYNVAMARYIGGFVEFKKDTYQIVDDTNFIHKIP